MEREGSGFDRMYEVLLSQGRKLPDLREGHDRVEVTIYRQILSQAVIDMLAIGDQQYQLSQREKITLGLLAQTESLSARDLAQQLTLSETSMVAAWLGRLLDLGLVKQTGRTQGTRYYVNPAILRAIVEGRRTTLQLIEPHRLQALIVEDLRRHPQSSISDIHSRTAPELPRSQIRRSLKILIDQGQVEPMGQNRGRRYILSGFNN